MQTFEQVVRTSRLRAPRTSKPLDSLMSVGLANAAKKCRHCGGTGWMLKDLPIEHPHFGIPYPCPHCRPGAIDDFEEELLRKRTGLRAAQRAITFEDIETTGRRATAGMVKILREQVENPTGIVLIHGGPGTGKSMAAAAYANAVLARGVDAFFTTGREQLDVMKSTFDKDQTGRDLRRWLERSRQARVLVVDNLDYLHMTPWALSHHEELIDERETLGQERGFGTVFIMNGDPHMFSQQTVSRLYAGWNVVIHNDDPDLRPALKR